MFQNCVVNLFYILSCIYNSHADKTYLLDANYEWITYWQDADIVLYGRIIFWFFILACQSHSNTIPSVSTDITWQTSNQNVSKSPIQNYITTVSCHQLYVKWTIYEYASSEILNHTFGFLDPKFLFWRMIIPALWSSNVPQCVNVTETLWDKSGPSILKI